MGYDTCLTCGTVVRDFDELTGRSALPDHKNENGEDCPDPVGRFKWNDGKHWWDENEVERPGMHPGAWVPIETCSDCGAEVIGGHGCQVAYYSTDDE